MTFLLINGIVRLGILQDDWGFIGIYRSLICVSRDIYISFIHAAVFVVHSKNIFPFSEYFFLPSLYYRFLPHVIWKFRLFFSGFFRQLDLSLSNFWSNVFVIKFKVVKTRSLKAAWMKKSFDFIRSARSWTEISWGKKSRFFRGFLRYDKNGYQVKSFIFME